MIGAMKDYITGQFTIFGQNELMGFGDAQFRVMEIERNKANSIVKKNHYSHKFYSTSYIHLGVYAESIPIGVLQFGYAMNPASQASVVSGTEIDEYLELNRMWLDDNSPKNSESRAISFAIKYIKRKYPKIKWIQSFADERCKCFGIVYQAANFGYYGEHTSNFWELDGIWYHKSLMERNPNLSKAAAFLQKNKERAKSTPFRQFRYLFFIDRRKEKDVLLKKQPYLKHYNP